MDRLTTRRADGSVETTGKTYSLFNMDLVDSSRGNDRYDVRLAEYEDTGLSPEQVQDIKAELEQYKRALELACKLIKNVMDICPADSETFSGEYCDKCSVRDVADCWKEHCLSQAKEADHGQS